MASGEPHFYQACYKDAPSNVDTDSVIVDDEDLAQLIDGCFDDDDDVLRADLVKDVESNAVTENDGDTNKNNDVDSGKRVKKGTVRIACTDNCKPLTDFQIETIKDLKESFSKPVKEFRKILRNVDRGCTNEHDPQKNGHPLTCYEDNGTCTSKLRILRAASPHYPMLPTFLRNIYQARNYDDAVSLIDQALSEGDVDALIKIATESDPNNEKSDVAQIFSSRYEESDSDINLRDPDLEVKLLRENVNLIAEFQKEIGDQNEHVCCSCRRLMRRGNLNKVFEKDKESEVWRQLEAFLTDYDPNFSSKQLLMCKTCKPTIK